MSAATVSERQAPRAARRAIAPWKATVLMLGCVLLLLAGFVAVRSVSTLREHADEAPSDGRLQQAHEDLVHAMVTGLAGAGLVVGVGLGGYAVIRRTAP